MYLTSFIRDSTALAMACAYGHFEISRFLVESGANFEAKDDMYDSFLRNDVSDRALYSSFGLLCLISILRGHTALTCSAHNGHLEITRFLVERKADVTTRDS
jgi:ankyrin repeat protein